MADRTDTDDRLEAIQDRVDDIRHRLPDNPGLTVVDEEDVPAYFPDDRPDGVVTQDEAEAQASPGRDRGQYGANAPG